MSNRRNLLMSYLANSFSWELYSKTYFYNELVPTTINSKNVLNKAKIVKVSGNGAIENQLVQNGNFESTTGWSSAVGQISISNNILTITLTQNLNANERKTVCVFSFFPVVNTNKYFISYQLKTSVAGNMTFDGNFSARATNSVSANIWNTFSSFSPATSNGNSNLYIQFKPSSNLVIGDTIQIKVVMVSNLTLREGTGNEPTTLTDNRIQNILNRGYIPYNLGKYKESDIGVVSTTKADTTALDTITFKAQLGGAINSHNTMEITNSAYVFTRNVATINMERLSWNVGGNGNFSYNLANIGFANKGLNVAQILCSKYPIGTSSVDKTIRSNSGYVAIYDTSITQVSEITGTLAFELATPQVISIPKKHLGIVDLGSLNWEYVGGSYTAYAQLTGAKQISSSIIANIYCSKYMAYKEDDITSKTSGISLANVLIVQDSSLGTNATQIKQALAGQYLFYETENEVADIENVVDIESGGTISANWFRWKENQLVPNGNFANGTSGWYSANSGTLSASNNKLTFTKTISGALSIYRANSDYPSFVLNHTYFVSAYVKASSNCTLLFTCGNTNTINLTINANTRTLLYGFATPTANNFVYKILDSNSNLLPINSTIEIEDCQLIDLTLGELEDANSIDDPRIQEIIRLGYIPTNTSGIYKEVSPVVLPNIDLLIKAK